MRILGWMQRKLMHNNSTTEMMKNPTIGTSTCFSLSEGQNYCTELPNSNIKSRKSNTFQAATNDDPLYQHEPYEPFDFLSIGTFGNGGLLNTDPPTPTLENLTDSLIEFTEDDLNMINLELEKFLDAEDQTESPYYDASQRSSHASVITLSCKAVDGADSEGHAHACPLQSYLFAASVETEREVKREKASLGELFERSNLSDENAPAKKWEGAQKQGGVAYFMKKVVKKFQSSATASASDHHGGAGANPNKKMLSKRFVKMFHKKVYPEEMAEKQFMKVSKSKNKSKDVHNKLDQSERKKSSKKLSWAGICGGGSSVNAGHWIKTDSDYLVLEL